jgi:hypothetical protein
VRDVYLARRAADIDIATSAEPGRVRFIFRGDSVKDLPRTTVKLTHQGEVRVWVFGVRVCEGGERVRTHGKGKGDESLRVQERWGPLEKGERGKEGLGKGRGPVGCLGDVASLGAIESKTCLAPWKCSLECTQHWEVRPFCKKEDKRQLGR